MRVAANLTMLFTEVGLLERYAEAAAAGFRLVEVSLPYSEKAEDLRRMADENGIEHVLINAPTGDWSKGFRGIAALPSQKQHFKESIETSIHYAKTLNCPRIHVMAGVGKTSSAIYLENIVYAAQRMQQEDLICLIEPINPHTVPDYYLNNYDQALSIVKAINSPNLRIMYDIFHAQQINGQISATVKKLKDYIGHVQVAQVPFRGEPDTVGEINYEYVFSVLKKVTPGCVVGCEYVPRGADHQHFRWVKKYGLRF